MKKIFFIMLFTMTLCYQILLNKFSPQTSIKSQNYFECNYQNNEIELVSDLNTPTIK